MKRKCNECGMRPEEFNNIYYTVCKHRKYVPEYISDNQVLNYVKLKIRREHEMP